MSKPILVFVHGRAQGGKDKDELRKEWIATWKKGLIPDHVAGVGNFDIRLPFYGDRLDELVAESAAFPVNVATRGDPDGVDQAFLTFRREIAEAAAAKTGVLVELEEEQVYHDRGPLQWNWVQCILQKLESVPGLSGNMIERFTRDVWVYLTDADVRDEINSIVAKALPTSGKAIVLGHSLGSVVAYDILRRSKGIEVPTFFTVGSPLGVGAIVERLREIDPIVFPGVVGAWYNAYDPRDAVALNPLDEDHFPIDPSIEEFGQIANHTVNAHGIVGYLNNRVLAAKIRTALVA
jgi:hypothetical protein